MTKPTTSKVTFNRALFELGSTLVAEGALPADIELLKSDQCAQLRSFVLTHLRSRRVLNQLD